MASNPAERLWSQAIDDGDYGTAAAIAAEQARLTETEARRQRILRNFGAAADPEHLLFPGFTLPRDQDCIDKRQFGTGEIN